MEKEIQELQEKIKNNTVNYLSDEDINAITTIVREENGILFKRVAGLLHKVLDQIDEQQKDIDDLKVFIKHVIKSNKGEM